MKTWQGDEFLHALFFYSNQKATNSYLRVASQKSDFKPFDLIAPYIPRDLCLSIAKQNMEKRRPYK